MPYVTYEFYVYRQDFKLHQHAIHPIEKGDISHLYAIIKQQQQHLEKMNKLLLRFLPYMNRVRKNFNRCQYLNNKYGKLKINFNDFIKNISANEENFQCVVSDNLASGMYDVLEYNLSPYKEIDRSPIRCFNMKKGVFYIYTGTEWRKMSSSEDKLLLGTCLYKLNECYKVHCRQLNDMNGMTVMTSIITQKMCGGGVGK